MSDTEILNDVTGVIRANFPNARKAVTATTKLSEIPGWDSVSHVSLMLDIEDKFGISVPEDQIFDIADIAGLIGVIKDKQANG